MFLKSKPCQPALTDEGGNGLRLTSVNDRWLLKKEIARLRALGYSFKGPTIEAQLGADAWVLQVSVVADKKRRKRK